jgi:hypothetical protein
MTMAKDILALCRKIEVLVIDPGDSLMEDHSPMDDHHFVYMEVKNYEDD